MRSISSHVGGSVRMSKDSCLSWAHKDNRLLDTRVVDKEWRKDKLPSLDIEVSTSVVK